MILDAGRRAAAPPVLSFLLIANPDAGGESGRAAREIAARLTACGREVAVEEARRLGDIREAARTTRAGVLLVAGGDGSINQAVAGLLDRPGPRPALGIVPAGTANVLAQELGLPPAGAALAQIFARGATRPLHVGLANGRPFTLMASAGVDAAVVKSVDIDLKKKIGRLAYAVAAARCFLRGGFPDVIAESDAGAIRAKCVVVAKSKFYGGRFVVDAGADVARPGLGLVALTEVSPRAALALARYFATGRLDAAGCVRKFPVRRVTLRGAAAAQIDGDYLGETPVEIVGAETALEVLA